MSKPITTRQPRKRRGLQVAESKQHDIVVRPITTRQPRRRRGLKMAETKQHEIVVRRVAGETKSSIAKSMGISRETVARVLSQGEYQHIVQKSRSQLADLLSKAIKVIEYFLTNEKRNKTNKAADIALAVLHGLQVLVPRSRADVAMAQDDEFEGWTDEQIEKYIATGQRPGEPEGDY